MLRGEQTYRKACPAENFEPPSWPMSPPYWVQRKSSTLFPPASRASKRSSLKLVSSAWGWGVERRWSLGLAWPKSNCQARLTVERRNGLLADQSGTNEALDGRRLMQASSWHRGEAVGVAGSKLQQLFLKMPLELLPWLWELEKEEDYGFGLAEEPWGCSYAVGSLLQPLQKPMK